MHEILFLVVVGVIGLFAGSFLGVVVSRWGTGRSVVHGRSKCSACNKVLCWYELIPVASFFISRRRCKGCGTALSWQELIVELVTAGVMFPLVFHVQWFLMQN